MHIIKASALKIILNYNLNKNNTFQVLEKNWKLINRTVLTKMQFDCQNTSNKTVISTYTM